MTTISLLPLTEQIQTPVQRWEQSASSYLNKQRAKVITAIFLGNVITFGSLVTGITFLATSKNDGNGIHKTGILLTVIMPSLCIGSIIMSVIIIDRIYRPVYPFTLDNAGEVVKIRNKLITENLETITSTFSANAPHLRKTGILCSEDADEFKSIIKKYQGLSKANKEINKFGDNAVSSNRSLKDRKDKVERSLIKVEQEWKAFQTEKLTKNLPNPSIEFNDLGLD
jgi:hypothetical protein